MEYYTLVLSTLHTKSPISGRLIDDAAISGAKTEDCAGTGVDLCVGCVNENEVFPGDGGGDGGRPVTGVPGCPARYTPGCWSEDAVG